MEHAYLAVACIRTKEKNETPSKYEDGTEFPPLFLFMQTPRRAE